MKIYSWILIIVLFFAAKGISSEPDNKDSIETTRTIIDKWVETQRTISKDKQDWVLATWRPRRPI